jgi:heme oxygenase
MAALAILRARTARSHDQVDAAFSEYSFGDEGSYRQFLLAHAHALAPAEVLLSRKGGLPVWRPRTALLAEDLADLGARLPLPLSFEVHPHPASAWGVHYVLEGSRLGGKLLADRVPASLPARYLRAIHEPGEWRATRGAIEAQASAGGAEWLEEAVGGAQACFDLYLRAAALSPP